MSASPTFPCPWCGAPITGASPGATFQCPYCKANVTAPLVGQGPTPGANMHMHGFAPAAPSTPSLFTGDVESLVCAFVEGRGFLLVGPHAPGGQPSRLRAVDMTSKQVAWEAFEGQTWLSDLEATQMLVQGKNLYVCHKRSLYVLDVRTGERRWAVQLPDAVDTGYDRFQGPHVVDPFAETGRGAILVRTVDNGLHAFDRDSGQALWSRSFGDKSFEMAPVSGQGAVIVRYGAPFVKIDIVNPAYAQPIASLPQRGDWSTDLGLTRVWGRSVVSVVESYGSEADQEGVLCLDGVTGQVHFFEEVEDLEDDDVAACAMGQRVFAPTDDGGMWVGPRGRAMPCPVPNHRIAAFVPAGPTLFLLCKKAQGTAVRRVVGIDPTSLAFRFDCGEAGAEPDDDTEHQLITDGYSVVFVASTHDDASQCELRSVDTTSGRMLWSKPIGTWRGHFFVGGHVVAWSYESVQVFAPSNGAVVAKYP